MIASSLDGKKYDVIVCGAGSAGVAAACSAAREGARTLLLERYGFGGGILTAAMIHTFDAIKSCADNDVAVVGGFASELLAEISALGGDATADNPPEALTVHPELHKIAIDRLLEKAGVECLFHAHACDIISDRGNVAGVEAALKDGRARFRSAVVIDATGDAELAHYAGVESAIAPDVQALTYHFRVGRLKQNYTWQGWEEVLRHAMQAAHSAGEIAVFGGPWVIRLTDDEISINSTRVYGNPTDPVHASRMEREGRMQMLQIWTILKRRVPALADSYILAGASQLHNRESRIIKGAYTLSEDDIRNGKRFADSIAVGAWPVDIHPANGAIGVHPHKENPPLPYEIPFRCLLPERVDGLLVAGKPISTTHRAHGSTRVPGTSLATGQAAGVAGALASRTGSAARTLDVSLLRSVLLKQGAVIAAPQPPKA